MTQQLTLLDHNNRVDVEGTANLPLITDPKTGGLKVFTPGHVYSPTPLSGSGIGKIAGPGALDDNERLFVSALVNHLDPEHRKLDWVKERRPSFIQKGETEYALLRNIERAQSAVQLRIGDEDWFYPDFEFWIREKSRSPERQYYCLIDPKGLQQGARGGWANPKVLCLLYKLAEISRLNPDVKNDAGESIEFIPKGALISTTTYEALQAMPGDDFRVYNENGASFFPTVQQFASAGIFFMEKPQYIEYLMKWLTKRDYVVDLVMKSAAEAVLSPDDQIPGDEIACYCKFLLCRHDTDRQLESTLAHLLKWTVACESIEQATVRLQGLAKKELVDFIKQKMFVIPENLNTIANPCRTLLERYLRQS
jgi:hypothetical protein